MAQLGSPDPEMAPLCELPLAMSIQTLGWLDIWYLTLRCKPLCGPGLELYAALCQQNQVRILRGPMKDGT